MWSENYSLTELDRYFKNNNDNNDRNTGIKISPNIVEPI